MIQQISTMQHTAATLDAEEQPVLVQQPSPQGRVPVFSSQAQMAEDLAGFIEQMAEADAEAGEWLMQGAPDVQAPIEPEHVPGTQEQEADLPPLVAEQWLQGMQDQRLVVIEARDGSLSPVGQVKAQPLEPEFGPDSPRAADPLKEDSLRSGKDFTDPLTLVRDRSVGHAVIGSAPASSVLPSPIVIAERGEVLLPVETVSVASSEKGQQIRLESAERTIRLQAPEAKWGEQMLHGLRKHVELQLQQRAQNVSIRLDPPELGSLEVFLSHESGRLSVQISAAHGDVARLLQQASERLRQELMEQNFLQVSVQVSADGEQRQQEHAQNRSRFPAETMPVMANENRVGSRAETRSSGRSNDVLVTV